MSVEEDQKGDQPDLGQRFSWLRDELILAADVASANGWRALPPGRVELSELSALLRAADLHPRSDRPDSFRSVGSVRFKIANLVSAHPAYRGIGVRVVDSEREVVHEFLRDPDGMHQEALRIRERIARSTRGEDSSFVRQSPSSTPDTQRNWDTGWSMSGPDARKDHDPELVVDGDNEASPATREQRMALMRLNGASLDQIGAEFGVTRERVRQILRDHGGPTSEEVRAVHKARLESQILAEVQFIDEALRRLLTERGALTPAEASAMLEIDEFRLVDNWPEDLGHLRIYEHEVVTLQWTDEECLDAIREASVYEYPLTAKAYSELLAVGQIKGPSIPRIHQRFGGWIAACDAAGVESGNAFRASYESRWTDEELLAYARDYFLDRDWPNSAHKYDAWKRANAPDGPSAMTLRNRLGTWSAIKRQALAPKQDGANS